MVLKVPGGLFGQSDVREAENFIGDLSITSQAKGDVLFFDGSNWARLGQGTAGKVLRTEGAAANPTFGYPTNLTIAGEANGDVLYFDTTWQRLAKGSNSDVLTLTTGIPSWVGPAAGGTGVVPIGGLVPWLKTYTNTPGLPVAFVECNGQTLNDAASVYNGQVIPDLNGNNNFVRGNSTSGGTGGAATIDLEHYHIIDTGTNPGGQRFSSGTAGVTDSQLSTTQAILPPYYNVVWCMRIK